MTRPMKVVSIETKRAALERMANGEAASAIAAELGFARQRLYAWQARVREGGPGALRGPGRPRKPAVARRFSPHHLSEAALRELIARARARDGDGVGERRDGPR